MLRKANTKCSICGSGIYRRPKEILNSKSGKLFCSHSCFAEFSKKKNECPICGSEFLGSSRQKTCSRACANKKRTGIRYNGEQKNNKDLKGRRLKKLLIENRGIVCEQCGFENIEILQVHHIIERCEGGSDELSNLKLLCPNCHYTIHSRKESGMDEDTVLKTAAPKGV